MAPAHGKNGTTKKSNPISYVRVRESDGKDWDLYLPNQGRLRKEDYADLIEVAGFWRNYFRINPNIASPETCMFSRKGLHQHNTAEKPHITLNICRVDPFNESVEFLGRSIHLYQAAPPDSGKRTYFKDNKIQAWRVEKGWTSRSQRSGRVQIGTFDLRVSGEPELVSDCGNTLSTSPLPIFNRLISSATVLST